MILHNHNHFTAQSNQGKDVGVIVGNIHRKSAKIVRSDYAGEIEKKVWHNYWDRCVQNETEYYNILNYMFWNPVKHGIVKEPHEYEWSSFYQIAQEEPWEFLKNPIGDLPFLFKDRIVE